MFAAGLLCYYLVFAMPKVVSVVVAAMCGPLFAAAAAAGWHVGTGVAGAASCVVLPRQIFK